MRSLRHDFSRVLLQAGLALSLVGAGAFGANHFGATSAATVSATANEVATATRPANTTPLSTTPGALPDVASVASAVRPATVLVLSLGRGGTAQGAGTGFIIDPSGVIVTNNHVVSGAQSVRVQLPEPDGRAFTATVVGTDAQTDLAVLRIGATGLPGVTLGRSSALGVGEWVVAIGNALALDGGPTVTAGVVGALGRDVEQAASGGTRGQAATSAIALYDLIQTDAAINEGNSGGPLVNLNGVVVGINTLGATDAQGIGFAIAIDDARPIIEALLRDGKVTRAYLGVQGESVTASLAAAQGLTQTDGVLVTRVVAGSPAAQARLQANDLIVAIGDMTLQGQGDLQEALRTQYAPGDTVGLRIVRGGVERTINVTLGTQA